MLLEYCVISGMTLFSVVVGAALVIIGKHSLMQWRLNKPSIQPQPVVTKQLPIAPSSNVVAKTA